MRITDESDKEVDLNYYYYYYYYYYTVCNAR